MKKVKFAHSAPRSTCWRGSCLQQQLSGAGGVLVRKRFETVDWSDWGCHRLARYQSVPQLISQGTETSQTAVGHFNSSPKSAAWTRAAASDDLPPASPAAEPHSYQHGCTVNNSPVPHFLAAPTPHARSSLIPAAPCRAQGHGVDIAYPSLNELIKGAVFKVLSRLVYLCMTGAPQITQTKGLSELLI